MKSLTLCVFALKRKLTINLPLVYLGKVEICINKRR